jgi:predicted DNA-binding WGR domain protein
MPKLDLDSLVGKKTSKKTSVPKRANAPRQQGLPARGGWEVRLEFVGGNSAKFWALSGLAAGGGLVKGHWGRIGSAGDSQSVGLGEAVKRLGEKLRKGYEVHSTRGILPDVVHECAIGEP